MIGTGVDPSPTGSVGSPTRARWRLWLGSSALAALAALSVWKSETRAPAVVGPVSGVLQDLHPDLAAVAARVPHTADVALLDQPKGRRQLHEAAIRAFAMRYAFMPRRVLDASALDQADYALSISPAAGRRGGPAGEPPGPGWRFLGRFGRRLVLWERPAR